MGLLCMCGRFFLEPSRAQSHHHTHQSAIAAKALFSVGPAEQQRHAEKKYNNGDYTLTCNYIPGRAGQGSVCA